MTKKNKKKIRKIHNDNDFYDGSNENLRCDAVKS